MLLEAVLGGILFIGDSHSTGCFGRTLDRAFRSQAGVVRTEATCGSSSFSWLKPGGHSTSCGFLSCRASGCAYSKSGASAGLSALLASEQPGLTVIALGSNMLKSDWSRTWADVVRMIQRTGRAGSRCLWIGPPQASARFIAVSEYEEFVRRLGETVTNEGCQFIDSNPLTDRNKLADQLHYGCSEATMWANRVVEKL